jgi:hypothetical protein
MKIKIKNENPVETGETGKADEAGTSCSSKFKMKVKISNTKYQRLK